MTIYTDLITSEHAKRPRFVETVDISTKGAIDQQAVVLGLLLAFDLDSAVGAQLDIIGLWIGRTRYIAVPITGIYFSWDTVGLGWNEGYWKGAFDPSSGLTALNDTYYRLLLRATIALNHWDGTLQPAIDAIEPLFPNNTIVIVDNQDMSISISVTGPPLNAIENALLVGGYLALKPAGVSIDYIV